MFRLLKRRKKKITCPVCGQYVFTEKYDICDVCGWENDPIQNDDAEYAGGANVMSLREARIAWEERNKESEDI